MLEIDDNKAAYYGLSKERNAFVNTDPKALNARLEQVNTIPVENDEGYVLRKEQVVELGKSIGGSLSDILVEFSFKGFCENNHRTVIIFCYRKNGDISVIEVIPDPESTEDAAKFHIWEFVGRYKRDFTVWQTFLKNNEEVPYVLMVERDDHIWQIITK